MNWTLAPTAEMVWEQLQPADRTALRMALNELAASNAFSANPSVGTLAVGQRQVNVMRLPNGYRAFFTEETDAITVFDSASPAQIESLRPVPEPAFQASHR